MKLISIIIVLPLMAFILLDSLGCSGECPTDLKTERNALAKEMGNVGTKTQCLDTVKKMKDFKSKYSKDDKCTLSEHGSNAKLDMNKVATEISTLEIRCNIML